MGRQTLDVLILKNDTARLWRQQPHDGLQQGGLPHTITSHQGFNFSLLNGKIYSLQNEASAVGCM